jgi:phosphoenolpyruvate synthase/pyruvate phosphate dikinase
VQVELAFETKRAYHVNMKDANCVWLADYTQGDIDNIANIIDANLPMAYGFVVPSNILTSIFLTPQIEHKLLPLFDSGILNLHEEKNHIAHLVSDVIRSVSIPKKFASDITSHYEKILLKEREYKKQITNDLHTAVNVLKHVYTPPSVRLTMLPIGRVEKVVVGEIAVIDAIYDLVVEYVLSKIDSHQLGIIASILVQRVFSAQSVAQCLTTNMIAQRPDQMIIYAYHGTKELEDCAQVYILNKSTSEVISQNFTEQPFRYVQKGHKLQHLKMHPQDAVRPAISDAQIQKIFYLSKDIEKKYYYPQKISFAFEKGELLVTKINPL